jgi:hypothetical protein
MMKDNLIGYGGLFSEREINTPDYKTDKGGVKVYKPEKAFNGYTLFNRSGGDHFYLIDMEGEVVHSWEIKHSSFHFAEITPAGNLLYSTTDRSIEKGRGVYELDWKGNLLWYYPCPVDHDHILLDNNNVLILCREEIINSAVRKAPWPDFRAVFSPYMIEVNRDKKIVWEWYGSQHIDELQKLVGIKFPREGEELDRDRDWAHCNTCSPLPGNKSGKEDGRFKKGNIIFSYREQDTIGIIEKDTGKIVWAWGPGKIIGQHKPIMLGNGHILLFDNGAHSPREKRGYSRIVEVDPLKEEIVWEYKASPPEDFYSPYVSNQQKLPNGNVLIGSGGQGRIFEVTPDKEIVWDYFNPFCGKEGGNHFYRHSGRYAPEFIENFLF